MLKFFWNEKYKQLDLAQIYQIESITKAGPSQEVIFSILLHQGCFLTDHEVFSFAVPNVEHREVFAISVCYS